MKKNMSNTERIIRVVVAALIAVLYLTGVIKGTLGLVLLIVGILLVITSLLGFCPIYPLLGINTSKKTE